MSRHGEFKILSSSVEEVQKTLNQWRHQYTMNIIPVGVYQGTFQDQGLTVIVERFPKERDG